MTPPLRHRRVRVFRSIRSAHLERAHALAPASLIYAQTRYDFDASLAGDLDLHRLSTPRAVLAVLRSRVDELEITEPLSRSGLWRAVAMYLAVRLGGVLRRHRTVIGTYAIENLDPYEPAGRSLLPRTRRALERRVSRWLVHRLDRVAFGTDGAGEVYERTLGPVASGTVVPALPTPCACLVAPRTAPADAPSGDILFLGALIERKGFDLLTRAWPLVRQAAPEARLTIVGKGALESLARELAASDPLVDLEIDPSRARIHELLRGHRVLVLPSRRMPHYWREQVGLPIVEALAHGLTVVTTDETGLADWLGAHGHHVLVDGSGPDRLAEAVLHAHRIGRTPADVVADLPDEDGRVAADRWMWAGPDDTTATRPGSTFTDTPALRAADTRRTPS